MVSQGRRFRLASAATANALGVLGLALLAVVIALAIATRSIDGGGNAASVLACLAYGGIGLLVARRQPRNAVGWVLLAPALLLLADTAGSMYAVLVYRLGHGGWPAGPVAVLLGELWVVAIPLLPVSVLLFPDGVVSRRWRRALWAYLVIAASWPVSVYVVTVATIAGHRIAVDGSGGLTIIDTPTGSSAWLLPVQGLVLPVLLAFWLLFLGRQAVSFRRASDERRQQLKWLLAGTVVAMISGGAVVLVGSLDTHQSAFATAVIVLGSFLVVALPGGIGVGILKYRLYDIDRIISRTLAYALVTGLLIGVYAGLVLLATQVLRFSSPVAVAAATLVAAALFAPVRRRVQRGVDRRFNRARYDADQTVAAFALRLQDAVKLDAVGDDLALVVQHALEPAHLRVHLWERDRQ